jgi:hypothetical protein
VHLEVAGSMGCEVTCMHLQERAVSATNFAPTSHSCLMHFPLNMIPEVQRTHCTPHLSGIDPHSFRLWHLTPDDCLSSTVSAPAFSFCETGAHKTQGFALTKQAH